MTGSLVTKISSSVTLACWGWPSGQIWTLFSTHSLFLLTVASPTEWAVLSFLLRFVLSPFTEHSLPPRLDWYPSLTEGIAPRYTSSSPYISQELVGENQQFCSSHRPLWIIILHLHVRKRKFILSLYPPTLSFSSPFPFGHYPSFVLCQMTVVSSLSFIRSMPNDSRLFSFAPSIHPLWFQYLCG